MGYKITPGANGTKQVRKNGKIVNNLPNDNQLRPPQKPTLTLAVQTVTLEEQPNVLENAYDTLTTIQKFNETSQPDNPTHITPILKSVEPEQLTAKGEEAPALSVEVDDGNTRLYVAHPKDVEYVKNNPEQALAEKKAFPSITTCMKQVGDPEGTLQRWAVRQTAQEASRMVEDVEKIWQTEGGKKAHKKLTELLEKNSDNKTFISSWLSNTDTRNSLNAANRGTAVHAITEALARGEISQEEISQLPVEMVGYVRAYERFRAQFPELEVAFTEVTVINEKDQYMGTADLILKDPKGNYYAGDYKTNKFGRIYDKTGMQLAAVAKATHIVTPEGERIPLPKISAGVGVGLSPKGECNVTFFPVEPYYKRFTTALTMWFSERKAKRNPEPEEGNTTVHSYNDITTALNLIKP